MAEDYPIRPITGNQYAAFRRVRQHAFNAGPLSASAAERGLRQFEAERSLAAFDAALPRSPRSRC